MFNYPQWQPKLDLASKIALILTGFVIPISVTGFEVFLILTIVLSLAAGHWREKFKPLLQNQVFIFAMLIFFLLLISAPYSSGTWLDVGQSLGKYSKLLYLIFFMPLFVDDGWKRAGINAFLAAMFVTLVASFFKMFGWTHIGNGGLGTLFTNHINTGFLMAFALFIILHRSFPEKSFLKVNWFYLILFALFAVHLFFMNEGRTGYLVFAFLLPLFLWQKFRSKGLLLALVIIPVMLLALFVVSPNFKNRIVMIAADLKNYHHHQLEGNSVGLRMEFTKNSLVLIQHHPIVGAGVGGFRVEYKNHFPPAPGFDNFSNPQNEFLLIAVQLGLLGLAVFLWFFFTAWRASLKLDIDLKNYAQGMLLAFLVGCLCDSMLFIAIPGYFFVYFISLFFAPTKKQVARALLKKKRQEVGQDQFPLHLHKDQKIAFVMSPRLGDSLLAMIIVNNLIKQGFKVTVFGDYILALKKWFPGVEIFPRPAPAEARKILSQYDVLLHEFAVDVIANAQEWHPLVRILEQSAYNWLQVPMVDIQVEICRRDLLLADPVRSNNITSPANLISRKYKQRVVIHPTSTEIKKNWLPNRFLNLAKRLKALGYQPEFVVSAVERKNWLWLLEEGFALPEFSSLDDVAAWVYESGWFIGNDSGIGHLASNLGVPTLTFVMRPGVMRRWRPAWVPGIVLLPPTWLITRPLKEQFWKYCISVGEAVKAFQKLVKENS